MTSKPDSRAGMTALAIAAALATSASAGADPTDLRSPDARDPPTQPHTGKAAVPGPDLRPIDARDAAVAPGGTVTGVNPPEQAAQPGTGGFHWDDAAIGAGGTLGLILILAGGTAALAGRNLVAPRSDDRGQPDSRAPGHP